MKSRFYLIIFLFAFMPSFPTLKAQEKYVNIEEQIFRVKVFGEGPATVIFECGMSDSLEIWGAIPDSVAKNARVFLYDRADIGKSSPSRQERTIPNMVSELRSILQYENIQPPYILVGHSMGGMIARYFASEYHGELKGLLLLDPAPESFWNSMSKKDLKKYIKGGNKYYESNFPEQYRGEWYQFIPNLSYMDNLNINSQLAVILVSATAWKWYDYHENILEGLTNTRHIELEGEHHIFQYHPDLIVQYINDLISNSKVSLHDQ